MYGIHYMKTKPPVVRIVNHVRAHRTAAEMTQEQLADEVGVTRVTINCLEREVYQPSIELALKLARYFRLPVEKLFSLEEK